jgi:hypothetical protein
MCLSPSMQRELFEVLGEKIVLVASLV